MCGGPRWGFRRVRLMWFVYCGGNHFDSHSRKRVYNCQQEVYETLLQPPDSMSTDKRRMALFYFQFREQQFPEQDKTDLGLTLFYLLQPT